MSPGRRTALGNPPQKRQEAPGLSGRERSVRVLFLSDSHLGFDDPIRPRVDRRRRGPDFFSSFEAALAPARSGLVDLVIHGGDLFYRSRIPDSLVERGFQPLIHVAEAGVPVLLIPGNHERSRIPQTLFTQHPLIRIFDSPGRWETTVSGVDIAVGGFPHLRGGVRDRFTELYAATCLAQSACPIRLLCLHEIVEGAAVERYTFRRGEQVIRAADLPHGLAAILCGHVHRHQILRADLVGRPLPSPVVYPGSTERTSFAEKNEKKGYVILTLRPGTPVKLEFKSLETRPMIEVTVDCREPACFRTRVRRLLGELPADSIVRLRVPDPAVITAAALRAIAPDTMNVSVSPVRKLSGG